MRMAKLRDFYGTGFVYVNPDRVFSLEVTTDNKTMIRSSGLEEDYIIVDEPIDITAVRLENARQ